MKVLNKTILMFHDRIHRVSEGVNPPNLSLPSQDFFAFAKGLRSYKGTQAFKQSLDNAGYVSSAFHKRYGLKGPFLVDRLMKKHLDGLDFLFFNGENFREFELFINQALQQRFEVVRFNLSGTRVANFAGFIMVAEEKNIWDLERLRQI